jgi:polygalacturonase
LSPADEQKLDTARIQKAIDKCGKGRAVLLHVNETSDAFLSGPLELKPEIMLIVGLGVTLFASRDPALYAVSPGSCGNVSHGEEPSPQRQGPVVGGSEPRGCKPLISVDHALRSAIMGDGTIDGRGGEKMLGSQYSWWDLAEQARAGGEQQVPRLIVAEYSDNFTLYRITLRNSPNSHVVYNHGDGFTVWGLRIDTPQLNPHRRRQCIHQRGAKRGRSRRRDQRDYEPQSFLLGPRHVDRKCDYRWRRQDPRLRSFA